MYNSTQFSLNFLASYRESYRLEAKIQAKPTSIDETEHRAIRPSGDANSLPFEGPVILHGRVSMLVDDTNRVPLRQLAIFDAEYPSEAAVAPTATHLANWRPDNKLQTVAHVHARAVVYTAQAPPCTCTTRVSRTTMCKRYTSVYIGVPVVAFAGSSSA